MLRPRITPCLLLRNGGLVKTRQFGDEKYVGDPINAVKIFNEKAVDELIVLDIDATRLDAEPNYSLIQRLADEVDQGRFEEGIGEETDDFRQTRNNVFLDEDGRESDNFRQTTANVFLSEDGRESDNFRQTTADVLIDDDFQQPT